MHLHPAEFVETEGSGKQRRFQESKGFGDNEPAATPQKTPLEVVLERRAGAPSPTT